MPLTRRLYIIGSGPGGLEHLSPAAHAALESCTNLAGHGLIARRIDLTGQGDFAIAFYNAVSNKRSWQLLEARQILLRYRPPKRWSSSPSTSLARASKSL
ncbi:MAG: hypothetical protein F9K25_18050 [Candidatus Contendobacter sp.]|nr:MAG: hypothetical protein F9K25_18050 [Candidatus Contendobacter sp.]